MLRNMLCYLRPKAKAVAGAIGAGAVSLGAHYGVDVPAYVAAGVAAIVGWAIVYFAPKNEEC